MNKFVLGLAVVILAVGGWFVVTNSTDHSNMQMEQDSKKLPIVQLKEYDGNDVSLADFAGKPLVVNVWAGWCPFCREELKDFAALQKEFGDITVIAINRAEPADVSRAYLTELGVEDDMTFLIDPEDEFYRAIGGYAMPQTVFVDENGVIAFHKRGPMTLDEMRAAVKEYLQ